MIQFTKDIFQPCEIPFQLLCSERQRLVDRGEKYRMETIERKKWSDEVRWVAVKHNATGEETQDGKMRDATHREPRKLRARSSIYIAW